MMDSAEDESQQQQQQQGQPRKRPRKSRGRGLRTRTGCLTCRKRHKKCDEKQPVCGPCTISSRHCVFPHDLDAQSALEALTRGSPAPGAGHHSHQSAGNIPPFHSNGVSNITSTSEATVSHSPSIPSHSPGIVITPQNDNTITASTPGSHSHSHLSDSRIPIPPPSTASAPRHDVNLPVQQHDAVSIGRSPDALSYEKWSADFASTRWLDLLANDAAQADSGFSLAPSPAPENRGLRHAAISTHVSPALLNGQAQLPENLDPESERRAWQSDNDIILTNHEAELFRHFAERCARWLDIFDQKKQFSTYAIRLALQNVGLMKAILALSTKHRSKSLGIQATEPTTSPATQRPEDQGAGADGDIVGGEDNEWIRYYYETLHYVREALTYSSYTHSEELLATAVVISAYEMLDESDGSGNWQRHLKGVFWIQRSQDVDGACGGLRQAVWWAWLRQDVWAAFREKRPCLSFWRPLQDVEELDQHALADRAMYLLSQAMNYSAESRKADNLGSLDPAASMQRKRARDELIAKMERWRCCLGDQYNTLPTVKSPQDAFTPLWVHPPQFGVALQAYSFAQILITLHSPSGVSNSTGFSGFLKMQRTLAEAVETICGIAMELREQSCQIISAQCLYGAGLCVHDPVKREKIIEMMEECEARVGWAPMATWRDDLRVEWVKADGETP